MPAATDEQSGRWDGLFTRRQEQVIGCVAAGMTDEEIAVFLSISPRTVRMHCDVVRVRLAVSHRRQIPLAYRQKVGRNALDLYPGSEADGAGQAA